MLNELTKWLKAGQVTDALKATRDRDVWKVMIAYAKEHGTWLIDSSCLSNQKRWNLDSCSVDATGMFFHLKRSNLHLPVAQSHLSVIYKHMALSLAFK